VVIANTHTYKRETANFRFVTNALRLLEWWSTVRNFEIEFRMLEADVEFALEYWSITWSIGVWSEYWSTVGVREYQPEYWNLT
jgi:hypothetical protein